MGSPIALRAILAAALRSHYLADSVVVNQGTAANHLHLLTSGRARYFFTTEQGQKIILHWITPGEIFGVAALLSTESTYLVSTETVADSRVLVWERSTIRRLGAQYPRLLENALFIASDYLTWHLADHVALVSRTARERLARVLLCLAETIGHRCREGVEIDVTNEELASAANITPFTASRLLSEWQSNSALMRRRGRILLHSPQRLSLRTV